MGEIKVIQIHLSVSELFKLDHFIYRLFGMLYWPSVTKVGWAKI